MTRCIRKMRAVWLRDVIGGEAREGGFDLHGGTSLARGRLMAEDIKAMCYVTSRTRESQRFIAFGARLKSTLSSLRVRHFMR